MTLNPLTWIKSLLTQKYVASLVRTLMSALSGYLLSAGLREDQVSQLTDILVALFLYGGSQLWSWIDKAKNQKAPVPPVVVDGGLVSTH